MPTLVRMITPKCVAYVVIAIHVILLVISARCHSPTPDEIAHVVSGLSHWQLSDFSLYRVNPPLPRMVATLPIYSTEPAQDQWQQLYVIRRDGGRGEFETGNRFIESIGTRFFQWIVIGRLASIPFSILGALVCFAWARDLYGEGAGLLATVLWCVSPMVLGFGAIITPDVPSAALGAMAIYTFCRWLQSGRWRDATIAGLSLAGAELSKTTWIVLPLPMICAWLALRFIRKGKQMRFLQLFVFLMTAWLAFLCGYDFRGVFVPLNQYAFQSKLLRGDSPDAIPNNRFAGTWLEDVPVPFPRDYVAGLDFHKADVEGARYHAYLRGTLRREGWWYYYLYALGVKCTVGGIMLFCSVTIYRAMRIERWPQAKEWVLIAPVLLVITLLSLHTGLNMHSRYLLPIFPPVIVWCSQSIMIATRPFTKFLVILCATSSAVSSIHSFPHSMSYFNELVGGSSNGRFHLLNSNVDWGQDLFFLRSEMENRRWNRIGLACWANYDVRVLGIAFDLPPVDPSLGQHSQHKGHSILQPGQYAISACFLHGYPRLAPDGGGGLSYVPENGYRYFQEFEPVGQAGFSMLLYDISTEDILRSKTWRTHAANLEEDSP